MLLLLCAALAAPRALRADAVLDPVDGLARRDRVVVVDDGVIVAIGREPPPGVEVLELPGLTLVPGYIDAHTHLCSRQTSRHGASMDRWAREADAYKALAGAHKARSFLNAGFTTVRDLGNAGNYADTMLKRAIDEGLVPGPELIVAGKIIAPFGGQTYAAPDERSHLDREYISADSPDAVRRAVREVIYFEAGVVKVVVDPHDRYTWTPDELRVAVQTAHAAGRRIAAHTQSPDGAALAIEAGVDSIEHGWNLTDAQLRLLATRGIPVVPTPLPASAVRAMGASPERAAASEARSVAHIERLHRAGVSLVFGVDLMVAPLGEDDGVANRAAIGLFARAGLSPEALLRALTSDAAALLGLEDRGRVAAGQRADLLGVSGAPAQRAADLEQVRFVMQAGRVVVGP